MMTKAMFLRGLSVDWAGLWARCEAALTLSCDSALLLVLSAFVNAFLLLLRSQRTESAKPSDYSLLAPAGLLFTSPCFLLAPQRNQVTVNNNTGKVPEGLVSMAAWAEPAHPRAPQGTVSPRGPLSMAPVCHLVFLVSPIPRLGASRLHTEQVHFCPIRR